MSKEFITMAHYPDSTALLLERHTSSYGLCTECSGVFTNLVPYPCPAVKEVL